MSRLRSLLTYSLIRVGWWLGERLPLRTLRNLLEGIASLGYRVDTRWADRVRGNLGLAFPDWTPERLETAVEQAFRYWGRLAAEIIHARDARGVEAEDTLRVAHDAMDQALARGRGVLILTAHIGNFELLGRLVARDDVTLATFHRQFKNPYFDTFFHRDRESMNLLRLGRGAGVREALRLLGRGAMVAAPLDQNQRPGRGVFVDMFGHPACTSTVLARLSLASGAPVLPVFGIWEGDDIVPVVGQLIEPDGPDSPAFGLDGRAERVRALTARYTNEIEAVVRRYPEQWNWVHRRWKTQPDDAVKEASVQTTIVAA